MLTSNAKASSLALLSLWLLLNTICNFFNRILFHHLGWHFPVLLTMTHGIFSMAFYVLITKVRAFAFPFLLFCYFQHASFAYEIQAFVRKAYPLSVFFIFIYLFLGTQPPKVRNNSDQVLHLLCDPNRRFRMRYYNFE